MVAVSPEAIARAAPSGGASEAKMIVVKSALERFDGRGGLSGRNCSDRIIR
jgi:hypothetical protein